jgi:hypothetical protein
VEAALAASTRLLLLVAIALAAGCGSGGNERLTKDEYVNRLRALESSDLAVESTTVFTQMAAYVLPQSQCADKARTLHRDLDRIVEQVDGLRPPFEVQRIQDDFVEAGRQTVDTIGGLAREVEHGELQCGQAYNQRAYGLPSTNRALDAIDELGRRGYLIGLNSGD